MEFSAIVMQEKLFFFLYGKTVNVTSLVEAFSVEMKVNKKAK